MCFFMRLLVFLAKLSIIDNMRNYEYSPSKNGNLYEKPTTKLANNVISVILWLCIILGLLVVAITSTFYVAEVKYQSMYPTINFNKENDIVYYTTIATPKKGDIVIVDLEHGAGMIDTDAIKRLIATGGDTICFYNQSVLINGKAINEPYLEDAYKKIQDYAGTAEADAWKNNGFAKCKEEFETWCENVLMGYTPYNTNFSKNYFQNYVDYIKYDQTLETYVLRLPEDYVFFLGDNRGNSTDCSEFGPIEKKYMLVKVDFISPYYRNIISQLWIEFLKKIGIN